MYEASTYKTSKEFLAAIGLAKKKKKWHNFIIRIKGCIY